MAAFDLPQEYRDIFGGAAKLDIRQMPPTSPTVTGSRPGQGAASGFTTFQWQESQLWWVPSLSYFLLKGHFLAANGTDSLPRPPTGQLGYCDNWPSTLMSQVELTVDSNSLELLNTNPAVADTALTYASVDRTYLKSFASNAGIGEGLQTRIINSAHVGAAVSGGNYKEVVACFRPALSTFDCPHALPPGPLMQMSFAWSPTGEQAMIESVASKIAGTDYTFIIDSFVFFRAAVQPEAGLALPSTGIIELNPVLVNRFTVTGTNSGQQNIQLPPRATRMLICAQDGNTANNYGCGQNGINPATDMPVLFSNGATQFNSSISQLYVSLPQLGTQAPNPQYTFTAPTATGGGSGFERAFADFIAVCKGGSGGYEGSVPFGNADVGVGAQVNAPLLTGGGPIVVAGNPENDQQLAIWTNGTGATTYTSTSANRTALYGWIGRKAIFAIPLVRGADVRLSDATVNITFDGVVTSVNVYTLVSYQKTLAVERESGGRYRYQIMND